MIMNYRKTLAAVCLSVAALAASAENGRDDVALLLNARISGSTRIYESSARALASIASSSNNTQAVLARFLLAVISTEPDAPKAAKLSPETRADYLAQSRNRILALAQLRIVEIADAVGPAAQLLPHAVKYAAQRFAAFCGSVDAGDQRVDFVLLPAAVRAADRMCERALRCRRAG